MDYNSYKIKDDKIDSVSKHVSITQDELDDISRRVGDMQGLRVKKTVNTGRGIAFIGAYGVKLAEFNYVNRTNSFEIKLNPVAKDEYYQKKEQAQRKERQKRAKRRFILQKTATVGTIAAFSVAAIIGLHSLFSGGINVNPSGVDTEPVAQVQTVNLSDAEIPIVLKWADYAMGEYRDDVEASEYSEYLGYQYDELYQNSFAPMYSSYENYYELEASGLPEEMIGNSKTNYLGKVRSYAMDINDEVSSRYQFENTVFANAIVKDTGDLSHASDVEILIPLDGLKGTEYSIGNLPDDAVIHEGEVYISADHIYKDGVTMHK